ncbi:MAG: Bifunctional protein FolD [Candidatus Roizmanbacteria bacterium GW2011_GWC2_37_13]|uniref:Bifunctional protein FolD n=1 Tax=Candidatus Roizmanbacteria bacterium GW2011_GWC2_37_13 TaxID=1618486 RepID=A0A0G0G9N0_9BACT|nr:MAG: bifunctional 5,10-methylene-tetrahydrofolate dehydrogenase/5,10-methylene-tetrahydrofolate cyclohydrolase, methylenetetrahydrofolate dehydrogenase (NADP+) / methenyltetrahydrofolate cyclohydrolase [Candidatus Roizmanbacteria bacterium GW2011_GWC1_37_12]KKQ26677.1 MAG: Bifunctional protein FolD [Candidatus Roizmanbacteria bacterium GW2011_GWC2_37_13]
MLIDGKKISLFLGKQVKKEVKKLIKNRPLLTVFLIGDASDQISFVKIKSNVAKKLGIEYNLIHLKNVPNFISFANRIKEEVNNSKVTGIIIQQPLPAQLSTESIYDYIPQKKEIEGHRKKFIFYPPIGLAVLTIIKYIFSGKKIDKRLLVNLNKDRHFFKKILKNKKIVLVGRGATGGKPIGHILQETKINYINVNSQTINPEEYFKSADIIITAVGKKIIDPSMLKPGVILINAGLRKENGKLRGDYEEKEIKNIASYYTPTPGGVGPIDVIYLYKNLVDAAKLQK